ncbi:kinase-like domain-containing protein [Helicostylum pulchrum]|nr:kinase-like domain-containing protein [Helicostylum pulchrum]
MKSSTSQQGSKEKKEMKKQNIEEITAINNWDPPFDIQRPNCIPGYGPYTIDNFKNDDDDDNDYDEDDNEYEYGLSQPSIHSFDEEDMFDTKKSNTPSSSGDSGYGTTRRKSNNSNKKVQDLFEALFAPVTPPTVKQPPSLKIQPSSSLSNTVPHSGVNSKLSLLFSKKVDPHYVKYQTWSNNQHQKSAVITNLSTPLKKGTSVRRPHEESLFKSLPPIIKVEKEIPDSLTRRPTRNRRRTDASILQPTAILSSTTTNTTTTNTNSSKRNKHVRCKSIGSTQDMKPSVASPIDPAADILDHFDEKGTLTARYRLGNVIGKGHFGTVFRALDLLSGKTVAIKQISLKDSRKSDIEDMMQEATLLSSLTHTNIVKYEGFIQTHEHMNIVLEFVENGSLLNTLKSFGNALPEHLVASYCQRILEGLTYLHKQDVVHCDLKAANILTTKSGDVKLSDFGVSLNLKLKNHEDSLVSGTPFWMSPEVIELKGASVQSDIWYKHIYIHLFLYLIHAKIYNRSLGCTVIELCTGKPPYADLITMTAMFKIVEEDCPPLPANISDDLENFLKLCFKKNPVERPTAQHLLYHPWVTQQPVTTTPLVSPIIPKPETRNNSTILDSYLKKNTQKDDKIIIDTSREYNSPPVPRCSPIPPNTTATATTTTTPPHHSLSPKDHSLPSFQSKSLFANKFSQRQRGEGALLTRQSMPVVSNQFQQQQQQKQQEQQAGLSPHVHNLIECSFPKGAGKCKVCSNHIKHDALVCKDFCGYICHKQCKVINTFNGGRRRASDQRSPSLAMGPTPRSSVSSQLREKFSFSRILSKPHHELDDIIEDNTLVSTTLKSRSSSWWKKNKQTNF